MKKNQIIFIILSLFLYLLWSYLSFESLRKDKKAFLSDFNLTIKDMNQMLIEDYNVDATATFTLWDLEKSSILKNRESKIALAIDKNSSKKLINKKNINLKNRTICLEKNCWEFLGVVTSNGETVVTLLSTKPNSRLETFRVNDMLIDNLMIEEIRGEKLLLKDTKEKKEFTLKLFAVDISKYMPKKVKKEENE